MVYFYKRFWYNKSTLQRKNSMDDLTGHRRLRTMKMKWKLVGMVLLPMVIASILIAGISMVLVQNFLDTEQASTLKVALEGYSEDVNAFQDQDVDITVFEGDTRTKSSIQGVEGTKASDEVIKVVLEEGKEFFDTDVDVHGTAYYGYYIPTENGMLFAGKPRLCQHFIGNFPFNFSKC